jgi:LmbE family N-acetylglucosaminyl deacetylase
MKKLLIVAAHPDDEVLGCFGAVARFVKEGHEAYTLVLGRGKSARGGGGKST